MRGSLAFTVLGPAEIWILAPSYLQITKLVQRVDAVEHEQVEALHQLREARRGSRAHLACGAFIVAALSAVTQTWTP